MENFARRNLALELRNYQATSNARIRERERSGPKRLCIQGPTGSGKTVQIADLLLDPIPQLLLTHRRVLLDQTSRVLTANGIKHGMIAAGYPADPAAPIQLAMWQTIWSRMQRNKSFKLPTFARVHGDEIHCNAGHAMTQIFDSAYADGATTIGWTASPAEVSHICDELIVTATVPELIAAGHLVRPVVYGPDMPDMEMLERCRRNAQGEYNEKDLAKVFNLHAVFGRVVEQYNILNPERKPAILFAPGVPHSIWFAQKLTASGIRAAHLDGDNIWLDGESLKSDTANRERLFALVTAGDVKVLCNRFVCREGVDLPCISHIINATAFGSRSSWVQSNGRGLRPFPGKEKCVIQDHGGNWLNHPPLDSAEPWDMETPERVAAKIRIERIRGVQGEAKEPEPITCPKCNCIRLIGDTCPECGHRAAVRSRWVLQVTGELKLITGEAYKARPAKREKTEADIWSGLFWGNRKNHPLRTPNQIRGYYGHSKGVWLPKTLPLMPKYEDDWSRPIGELSFDDLIKEGAMADGKPSEKQAALLTKYGYDPTKYTFDTASAQIEAIKEAGWKRPDGKEVANPKSDGNGPATDKQKKLLKKHKLPSNVTFGEASKMIDSLADNNWEVPEDLAHLIVEDEVPAFGS